MGMRDRDGGFIWLNGKESTLSGRLVFHPGLVNPLEERHGNLICSILAGGTTDRDTERATVHGVIKETRLVAKHST